ncbi:MAG: carboxylating nicotinate-nucleotide diphosphorylase [Bacteroidota bacterium]
MSKDQLKRFIEEALREDIGSGDHTTLACLPADARGKAVLLAKQEGILSGTRVAGEVFRTFDPGLSVEVFMKDGSPVKPGDQPFLVSGRQQSILQTERLVLNIIQRMSGIATQTALYVERVKGTGARILDTRKTTPNMRFLEKEAVRTGGGFNHRSGLYDMILIKDNHVDYAGDMVQVIKRAAEYVRKKGLPLKIEVEARDLEDVRKILDTGEAFRILLDNFAPGRMLEAVELIGGRVETEASGGITLENVRDYALTGVDYISVGALTHHILSLDFSLKATT